LGYVYLVTNLVNGKKYVGCTKVSVEHRWRQHRSAARKGSLLAIHAALRKYGKDSFKVEILETVRGRHDELLLAEVRQIAAHNCVSPAGYNLTNGGEGVDFLVPEVRTRHAESVKSRSANPDWQRRTAEANRRKVTDPDWLVATTEANRRKALDPEWQQATTEGARKRSIDPAWQRNVALGAIKRAADPDWRKANLESLQELHAEPAFVMAHAEGIRRRALNPEWLRNVAEAARRRALDPEWLGKSTDSLRKAHAAQSARALAIDATVSSKERSRRVGNREAVRRYRARKKLQASS
jgi:group I intron endonuclease